MAIIPSSGTENGVTGWFSLSGSTVTVSVSSTSLVWRVNGTKSGGDHGTYYIYDTKDYEASFTAEDGHSYAFQVCSSGGNWSYGEIFTVSFGSDDTEDSGGNYGGGVGWGFTAEDVYFGDKCNVSWVPATTYATYRLEFVLGSYRSLTDPVTPGTSDFFTYTEHTIPLSAANNIPNSDAGVFKVSVIEYSDNAGNNEVTRSVIHFTATLRDSIVPSISSCEAILDNSANSTLSSWNVALAKISKVRLRAGAAGVYGSSIVSYTIRGDYNVVVTASGSSKSLDYTGQTINTSGNKAFTITCTDTRGRVSAQKVTNAISFLPYSEPKISKLLINKETYGDSSSGNDRMVVTATWTHDSVQNKNSSNGKIYYKTTSAEDWTLHSGLLKSGTAFTLSNLVLKEYTSYNFMLVVQDALGSTVSMESFASTTPVLLDFKAGGDGIGIGKVCESPGMEVSMDATFFREVYIGGKNRTLESYIKSISPTFDMIYPVGSIYISMNSANPSTLFGGSWKQLPGRFLLGAGSNDANTTTSYGSLSVGAINRSAGEKGGEVQHILSIDEMPEHNHTFQGNSPEYSWASGGSNFAIHYEKDAQRSQFINSTGGSKAHNNMPPYLAVYMWERVA